MPPAMSRRGWGITWASLAVEIVRPPPMLPGQPGAVAKTMTNMFDLSGRVAVVTGSAQGMGRAMATAFAEAGADVVLLDRNKAGIEATAQSIAGLGRKALPIAGDVTDVGHMEKVFATVDKEFGRVDVLGNVAGEARAGA